MKDRAPSDSSDLPIGSPPGGRLTEEHTCHMMNPPFPYECAACAEDRVEAALDRASEHLPPSCKAGPIYASDASNAGTNLRTWQPIETAPKDGTDILVHDNDAPGLPTGRADACWAGNTAVAAWWSDDSSIGHWVCYMDRVSDPDLHFTPTHWMPLPEPPGLDAGGVPQK